jgi:hypothetical protein
MGDLSFSWLGAATRKDSLPICLTVPTGPTPGKYREPANGCKKINPNRDDVVANSYQLSAISQG